MSSMQSCIPPYRTPPCASDAQRNVCLSFAAGGDCGNSRLVLPPVPLAGNLMAHFPPAGGDNTFAALRELAEEDGGWETVPARSQKPDAPAEQGQPAEGGDDSSADSWSEALPHHGPRTEAVPIAGGAAQGAARAQVHDQRQAQRQAQRSKQGGAAEQWAFDEQRRSLQPNRRSASWAGCTAMLLVQTDSAATCIAEWGAAECPVTQEVGHVPAVCSMPPAWTWRVTTCPPTVFWAGLQTSWRAAGRHAQRQAAHRLPQVHADRSPERRSRHSAPPAGSTPRQGQGWQGASRQAGRGAAADCGTGPPPPGRCAWWWWWRRGPAAACSRLPGWAGAPQGHGHGCAQAQAAAG